MPGKLENVETTADSNMAALPSSGAGWLHRGLLSSVRHWPLARSLWVHSGLKRRTQDIRFARMASAWHDVAEFADPAGYQPVPGRVLILPPDPREVIASLGDLGMFLAIRDHHFRDGASADMTIMSNSPRGAARAAARNWTTITPGATLGDTVERLLHLRPEYVYLVGADVLDGVLDPVFSAFLLMTADLLRRAGVKTRVTGFSLARNAYPGLAEVFRSLNGADCLCVRDPVSHDRLSELMGEAPRLVADLAFLVQPAPTVRTRNAAAWMAQHRQQGRKVVGLNLSPLNADLTPAEVRDSLIPRTRQLAEQLVRDGDVAVLLLPHDFRALCSDQLVLEPVMAGLSDAARSHVGHITAELDPTEVKEIVGQLDLVVTARMHLAIATLGACTPALVIGSDAKLSGLLDHFRLPAETRISVEEFLTSSALVDRVRRGLAATDEARAQIATRLPAILDLSRANLIPEDEAETVTMALQAN